MPWPLDWFSSFFGYAAVFVVWGIEMGFWAPKSREWLHRSHGGEPPRVYKATLTALIVAGALFLIVGPFAGWTTAPTLDFPN